MYFWSVLFILDRWSQGWKRWRHTTNLSYQRHKNFISNICMSNKNILIDCAFVSLVNNENKHNFYHLVASTIRNLEMAPIKKVYIIRNSLAFWCIIQRSLLWCEETFACNDSILLPVTNVNGPKHGGNFISYFSNSVFSIYFVFIDLLLYAIPYILELAHLFNTFYFCHYLCSVWFAIYNEWNDENLFRTYGEVCTFYAWHNPLSDPVIRIITDHLTPNDLWLFE